MEDPLSEDILRGNFKGKDLIRITRQEPEGGEKHLYFDASASRQEGRGPRAGQVGSDAT